MLYLKKYFTEGLIQFTILLSLIGVRVDLDTYLNNQLPPLREIILGPSSAYTQTQFHNLRNTLDGYGIHPKSVDLDHFFATRRLLNQVRSLDHLRVPSTELSAWLVHRDPETVVSATSQSGPSITLDNGGSLEDVNNSEASAMRGAGDTSESTYSLSGEDSLGAVAPEECQEPGERETSDDLSKELTSLGAQTSLSMQECLRLLEATFPFGEESEFQGTGSTSQLRATTQEAPSTSQGIPLQATLPQSDTPLDLEQQWQDIMSIMELQDMEVNNAEGNTTLINNDPNNNNASSTDSAAVESFGAPRTTLINQDVSLQQALLPTCSQDFPTVFNPELDAQQPTLVRLSSSNSSNINSTFGATNL
ncbi:hypothetical protein DNTS_002574, partial [Danionella cerebrum]